MSYSPPNANGQAIMANSSPVVVASDQSAIPNIASSLPVTFTTSTVQPVASTDTSSYRWVSVQVNSQGGSSTITFQGSNDNSTWVSLGLNRADNITTTGGGTGNVYTSTTATGVWYGALNCRYFRLNVTGIVSGTTAGTIVFSSAPAIVTVPTMTAVQNGTWTVQPGNTANTTAWKVDGSAVTQPISGTVTSNTNLAPSSTALNTYSVHITTNTTNTPTSSTAYISSVAISNEVGGTTSTITIQDKQGTPLKLVNGVATTALTTAPTILNFQTPIKMVSGIDIITAGAVAATVDVWVNYYQ